jgi:phosphate starvation-inducible PhoH-like protein
MRQPASVFLDTISLRIGKAAYEIALKSGDIELVPFEVMRGRPWKNAFVLLDEA